MEKVIDRSYGCIPVYNDGKEVLFGLVQHNNHYYNFPKGHPDPGETIEETIKREAFEEAQLKDLQIDLSKEFPNSYVFNKDNKEIHKTAIFYVAHTKEMTNKASEGFTDEIINVVWLNKEDANAKLTFQSSKDILKQVCDYLNI